MTPATSTTTCDEDLFNGVSNPVLAARAKQIQSHQHVPPLLDIPAYLPTPQECICHLKLLRVFAALRLEISQADGLFGLRTNGFTELDPQLHIQTMSVIYDKRWNVYVTRAAHRFEKWWMHLASKWKPGGYDQSKQANQCLWRSPGALEAMINQTEPMVWSEEMMPPVDVLMVLHSFMLNPRCFLQDCIRYGLVSLWKAGLPWKLIDQCIDPRLQQYCVNTEAPRMWEQHIKRPWSNLADMKERTVRCTACRAVMKCRWTTAESNDVDRSLKADTGFADKSFRVQCVGCGETITQDTLAIQKLRSNVEDLRRLDIRLPGTLLAPNGQAISIQATEESQDPNTVLQGETGNLVLAFIDGARNGNSGKHEICLGSIHQLIRQSLLNALSEQRKAMDLFLETTTQPSMFSLSLADAVIRQCSFIETMEKCSWLYSPALNLTLSKLLTKYPRFFTIMAEHPNNIAVPTHAVDLAWHTHQLSPLSYYRYSIQTTNGVFIDHDDKLGEGTLTTAFDFAKSEYAKLTDNQDEYEECLCWHCTTSHIVRMSHPEADGKFLEAKTAELLAEAQYKRLDADFAMEKSRSKRLGRQAPSQWAFLETYTWLYPDARPILQPEMDIVTATAKSNRNRGMSTSTWSTILRRLNTKATMMVVR